MFVFLLASGVEPMWTWLLLPVVLALLAVFTTAVAMIVSALNPRFRDTGIIWSVAVTALFYATPVLYPIEIVVAARSASCWRSTRWRRSSSWRASG